MLSHQDGERGIRSRRLAVKIAPFALVAVALVAVYFSFSPTDRPPVLRGDPMAAWKALAASRTETRAGPESGPESRGIRSR